MDAARFARVRRVYERAAELPTGDRTRYLDDTCGDDAALGREVRRMLAADAAPEFLARPEEATEAAPPPSRVGPYRVRAVLGRGGFGVVYLAEQREPVRRTVALKVLHHTRSDGRSVLRFQSESQTLARLQHPGIARLFDAGRSDDGQPYFAMEFVDGPPITAWADGERLPVDARLELFLEVCHAVQHAHQRGVVHRDLKPSNVLVEHVDGRAQPKVIDFGIAKLVDEAAGMTREGVALGTPGAMSPEQAAGEPIDTRTDVYALGVLLYDLLAGDLPFPRERLESAGPLESLRIVREEEPRSLSSAVRGASDSTHAVAARRGTDLASLRRALRGDLEWIVRKALAKDPDERYASVSALIADVERLRRDEPVTAREPETLYLLRKFVARHRVGVGIGLAAAALLVVGVLGLLWALRAVADARDDAIAQRREADRQRDRAVLNEYAAQLTAAHAALEAGDGAGTRRHLLAAAPQHRGWEWRHLATRCNDSLLAVEVGDVVLHAEFLDDHRVLLRVGDSLVPLDIERGRLLPGRVEVEPQLDGFLLLPDGRLVVDRRTTLELWDGTAGPRAFLHAAATDPLDPVDRTRDVRSMALGADGRTLFASDNYGTVHAIDLAGERQTRAIAELGTWCWNLAVLPDGERLVCARGDGRLEVRDVRTGAISGASVALDPDGVKALAVAPDGHTLYAAAGNRLHAVDARTGALRARRPTGASIATLALSADGELLYGGGGWQEGRLVAWDPSTLEVRGVFQGHGEGVGAVAPHPDGTRLVSGSSDGTVRVWPRLAPEAAAHLDAGTDARQLAVAWDRARFGTVSRNGRLSVWDAATLEPVRVQELRVQARGCALGAREAYVTGDVTLAVDLATGAVRAGDPPPARTAKCHTDPQERWLAAADVWTGRLFVWRLPELELLHELELGVTDQAVWDPARRAFVIGGLEEGVVVVEPESGRVLERLPAPARVWDVAQRDGTLAVVSGGLALHGPDGAREFAPGSPLRFTAAEFGPDGERLATGSGDRQLRLWTRDGVLLLTFDDSPKPLENLAFVDGGRRLVGHSYLPGSPTSMTVWSAPDAVRLER